MQKVLGLYEGNLDRLFKDVRKYDKIIETWAIRYPDSKASLIIEIDANKFYTLILDAESSREDSRGGSKEV